MDWLSGIFAFFKRADPPPPPPREKWRKDEYNEWTKEDETKLRDEVKAQSIYLSNIWAYDGLKMLIMGGAGIGKSSLINTMDAALTGELATLALSRKSQWNVTTQYLEYPLHLMDDKGDIISSFRACDFKGFGKHDSIDDKVIVNALKGDLEHGTKVASTDINRKKKNERFKAQILLVVFNACTVDDIKHDPEFSKMITTLVQMAFDNGISVAVFLTQCDRLDPKVKVNLKELHYSQAVKRAVDKASDLTGVSRNRIFPVVNYTDDADVTPPSAIQALLPIKYLLQDIKRRMLDQDYRKNLPLVVNQ